MAVTDAEIEIFKRDVSCAALLEQASPPWKLDKGQSTRDARKYRRGKGEILIVNHRQRGWRDPQSTAKGDVCSRRLTGVVASFPEAPRPRTDATDPKPAIRWAARPPVRRGSPG